MKVAEFIGMLFLARDQTHAAHLSTRKLAEHMATNDFYHGIIDKADEFAEAYQGCYALIGPIPLQLIEKQEDVLTFLQRQIDKIKKERYQIAPKEETALQNLIDEIIGLYETTIYKLKFLS